MNNKIKSLIQPFMKHKKEIFLAIFAAFLAVVTTIGFNIYSEKKINIKMLTDIHLELIENTAVSIQRLNYLNELLKAPKADYKENLPLYYDFQHNYSNEYFLKYKQKLPLVNKDLYGHLSFIDEMLLTIKAAEKHQTESLFQGAYAKKVFQNSHTLLKYLVDPKINSLLSETQQKEIADSLEILYSSESIKKKTKNMEVLITAVKQLYNLHLRASFMVSNSELLIDSELFSNQKEILQDLAQNRNIKLDPKILKC